MTRPIITLTTAFGTGSPYVAQMKGAILSINPEVTLVDVTHAIPPQDIRQGALALADVVDAFPADTIHVAVVDPGVGTDRQIIYTRAGGQHYVAPDNGLLSVVAERHAPDGQIAITNQRFFRKPVSSTFHGRDIMGPVAAHLSLGIDPRRLGPVCEDLHRIAMPEVQVGERQIQGTIVSFDTFGNLITDITNDALAQGPDTKSLRVSCRSVVINGLVGTYGAGLPLSTVALVGSSGMLEIAVVNGNAAQRLGIGLGDQVAVAW